MLHGRHAVLWGMAGLRTMGGRAKATLDYGKILSFL